MHDNELGLKRLISKHGVIEIWSHHISESEPKYLQVIRPLGNLSPGISEFGSWSRQVSLQVPGCIRFPVPVTLIK